MLIHSNIHTHRCSYTLTHTLTLTFTLTYSHTHSSTPSHVYAHQDPASYFHIYVHVHSHVHTHSLTHAHTHTHFYTHTFTHGFFHTRSHSHMLSTHKQPHSWADLRPVPAGGLGGGSSGETALWGACVEGALALRTRPQLWPVRAQQEGGRVASSPVGGPGPESLPGGHGDLS